MELTTHAHLVPRLTTEHTYAVTLPLHIHGMFRVKFILFSSTYLKKLVPKLLVTKKKQKKETAALI